MKGKEIDSLPSGTVLNSGLYTYIIEKVLGQGSFGITYLASIQILGIICSNYLSHIYA